MLGSRSAVLESRGITFRPLPIEDGVRMIAAAGGKSVVAHLPTLGKTWLTKFGDKLEALRDGGLWGVEYVCN